MILKSDKEFDLQMSRSVQKLQADKIQDEIRRKEKEEIAKQQRREEEEAVELKKQEEEINRKYNMELKRQQKLEEMTLKLEAKKRNLDLAMAQLVKDEAETEERQKKLQDRRAVAQLAKGRENEDRHNDAVSVATTQVYEGAAPGFLFSEDRQGEHAFKNNHLLHTDPNIYGSNFIIKTMKAEKNLYVAMRKLVSVTNEGSDPDKILDKLYVVQEREQEFLKAVDNLVDRPQEDDTLKREAEEIEAYLSTKARDQSLDCLTNRLNGVRWDLARGLQLHHPTLYEENRDLILYKPDGSYLPKQSQEQASKEKMERTRAWAESCSGSAELHNLERDNYAHLTAENKQTALSKSTKVDKNYQMTNNMAGTSGDQTRKFNAMPLLPSRDMASTGFREGQGGARIRFGTLDSFHESSLQDEMDSDKYSQITSGSQIVKDFADGGNSLLDLFPKLGLNLDTNAKNLAQSLKTLKPELSDLPNNQTHIFTTSYPPAKFQIKAQGHPNAALHYIGKREDDTRGNLKVDRTKFARPETDHISQTTRGGIKPSSDQIPPAIIESLEYLCRRAQGCEAKLKLLIEALQSNPDSSKNIFDSFKALSITFNSIYEAYLTFYANHGELTGNNREFGEGVKALGNQLQTQMTLLQGLETKVDITNIQEGYSGHYLKLWNVPDIFVSRHQSPGTYEGICQLQTNYKKDKIKEAHVLTLLFSNLKTNEPALYQQVSTNNKPASLDELIWRIVSLGAMPGLYQTKLTAALRAMGRMQMIQTSPSGSNVSTELTKSYTFSNILLNAVKMKKLLYPTFWG